MAKITDTPIVVFLAGVTSAFVAGITCWIFLESKIKSEVKETLKDPEVNQLLPKGDKGDSGADGLSIPVGGIFAYAGKLENIDGALVLPRDLQTNFEICDGEVVATEGSLIRGWRKPDLRGRFLRGMRSDELRLLTVAGRDRIYPLEGADQQTLDHSHEDGTLAAMYAPVAGGWAHYNLTTFPEKVEMTHGQGGESGPRRTGDLKTDRLIDVKGTTGTWSKTIDNRPQHSALVYLIRTR